MSVGPPSAYADALVIERNFLTVHGPAFTALLTNEPENAAISRLSPFGPWRAAARQHGL